jgi:hypothetical protein
MKKSPVVLPGCPDLFWACCQDLSGRKTVRKFLNYPVQPGHVPSLSYTAKQPVFHRNQKRCASEPVSRSPLLPHIQLENSFTCPAMALQQCTSQSVATHGDPYLTHRCQRPRFTVLPTVIPPSATMCRVGKGHIRIKRSVFLNTVSTRIYGAVLNRVVQPVRDPEILPTAANCRSFAWPSLRR